MKSKITVPLTLTVIFSSLLLCGVADNEKISTEPKRVSIFKNGLGYVERTGTLSKNVSSAELNQLPTPVHGTVWVSTDTKGVELLRILASSITSDSTERNVNNLEELLDANDGRVLELVVTGTDGKTEKLMGKLSMLNGSRKEEGSGVFSSGFMAPVASQSATSRSVRWSSYQYTGTSYHSSPTKQELSDL